MYKNVEDLGEINKRQNVYFTILMVIVNAMTTSLLTIKVVQASERMRMFMRYTLSSNIAKNLTFVED